MNDPRAIHAPRWLTWGLVFLSLCSSGCGRIGYDDYVRPDAGVGDARVTEGGRPDRSVGIPDAASVDRSVVEADSIAPHESGTDGGAHESGTDGGAHESGTDGGGNGSGVDGSVHESATDGSARESGADASALDATSSTYSVGGTISGLVSGDTVVLQDNGGDNLSLTANGGFAFNTKLSNGATYAVTVFSNPWQTMPLTCSVMSPSGTVAGADVTSVHVSCVPGVQTFTYSGAAQSFVVPSAVNVLTAKLWGAAGGSASDAGGNGGFVSYTALPVTPGETLSVIVGQGGSCYAGVNPETFGGGGAGSSQPIYAWCASGGGRSAIQRAGQDIMTAGGGGGTGYGGQTGVGGAGCGGPNGQGGAGAGPAAGAGGTLIAGGIAGAAATSGTNGSLYLGGDGANNWMGLDVGAGGGGGYYGGGGGGGTDGSASGAGGGGSCFGPAGTVFDGTGGQGDPDYQGEAGQPAIGGTAGNNGLVVLRW